MRGIARLGVLLLVICLLGSCMKSEDARHLAYYIALGPPLDPGDETESGENPEDQPRRVAEIFRSFSGAEVPIQRFEDPEFRVDFDEISKVGIQEMAPSPSVSGGASYVSVQLEVDGEWDDRMNRLEARFPRSYLLVRAGDRDLDLVPLQTGRASGVPGGSFRSRIEAETFYGALAGRIEYASLTNEEREAWQQRNQSLVELSLWYARCDPDRLRALDEGLYEEIIALEDFEERARAVDCGSDPPSPSPEASVPEEQAAPERGGG